MTETHFTWQFQIMKVIAVAFGVMAQTLLPDPQVEKTLKP